MTYNELQNLDDNEDFEEQDPNDIMEIMAMNGDPITQAEQKKIIDEAVKNGKIMAETNTIIQKNVSMMLGDIKEKKA